MNNKIKAIKFVRERTGLSLREAKYIVDVIYADNLVEMERSYSLGRREPARPVRECEADDFINGAFDGLIRKTELDAEAFAEDALYYAQAMAERLNRFRKEREEREDETFHSGR